MKLVNYLESYNLLDLAEKIIPLIHNKEEPTVRKIQA
jgi:hypothetical protein